VGVNDDMPSLLLLSKKDFKRKAFLKE